MGGKRTAAQLNSFDLVVVLLISNLVKDGEFVDPDLRRLGIRRMDLEVALRRSGAEDVAQVKEANLYPTGAIVVDLRPEARGASNQDIERLERKLDRLAASVESPANR